MREPVAPQSETSERGNIVELRIPSRAEWVGVARLAVAAIASRLQFPIEDIEDLKLAVAEACTNCIQHASQSEAVRIRFQIDSDKVVVTVQDTGLGFSGAEVAPKQLGEAKESGLGVFLIRSLMDNVEYELNPESGTKLTMTKHLPT
ncbi:MAG: ATP-binding protein [Candidatus Eremiobacter antarcticus]|nr:ATP-binding protein [Candidatus Eremiobacteraeota bacterium]MBC5808269.1 ATP-binding protein [Candidatus Eremiobacteraeota bacterium]